MTKDEITQFLDSFQAKRERTMVIVDFGNVAKWTQSLRWRIGIKELGHFARKLSIGKTFLRRFYYGADYGPRESNMMVNERSRLVYEKARMSGFEPVVKRVKYIHDRDNVHGWI